MKTWVAILVALALFACKTPKRERGNEEGAASEPAQEREDSGSADESGSPEEGGALEGSEETGGSAELVAVPDKLAGKVELVRLSGELKRPVDLDHAPGDESGRLFVVEQRGLIRVLRGDKLDDRPFLDVRKLVSRDHEEQGLLGLAFHPEFQKTGKLYINYTDKRGDTRVVEYEVGESDPERATPASAREIFSVGQPWRNHNGGGLEFGPDGKLYVGTGDGGAANDPHGAGQDRDNLLGKMLRLDVAKRAPKPEIVAIGVRNPWRYDFDDETGDLYIGDVGQNRFEWVHVVAAGDYEGKNLGWNVTEGSHCFRPRSGCDKDGITMPAVEYDHDAGCSITGGRVYRGEAIPELRGVYFYADYCTALLRSFRWSAEAGVRDHWDWKKVLDPRYRLATISAFGEDTGGELYVLSLDGVVYKLAPKG